MVAVVGSPIDQVLLETILLTAIMTAMATADDHHLVGLSMQEVLHALAADHHRDAMTFADDRLPPGEASHPEAQTHTARFSDHHRDGTI